MRHPWEQFVDDLWVPRGCLRCRIHASPVKVLLLMIFESLGAVWAVQFLYDFWVPRGRNGYLCPCVTSGSRIRWWFMSPHGLFALSNPCVTRGSSLSIISESQGVVCTVESMRHPWKQFVDDLWVPRGWLRCPMHASPVEAVLLMIFVTAGTMFSTMIF